MDAEHKKAREVDLTGNSSPRNSTARLWASFYWEQCYTAICTDTRL